ncbi:MAG: 50S ribosomal protein L6 [Clostridiales bacterium]|nr:50S ribosomal protein L6 [Clostridiales bacterium]HBM81683.1 50S ribosomal protein L6 [Clostridiaceae bacterium]
MSRIGKLPVVYSDKVEVTVDGNNVVTVAGPRGTLKREMHKDIIINVDENERKVIVKRQSDDKEHKALHGLTRALIRNMVVGVTDGFQKVLDLVGVGYRAQMQGKKLVLTLGFSHPVEVDEVPGVTFETPAANKIIIKGNDKELVGLITAKIRDIRSPEPYKGKGIRYENERVKIKEGKTGKK